MSDAPNAVSTTRVIAATGRFQWPIHHGHIEYLKIGQRRARQLKCPFVILTGPYDDELASGDRLCFTERRALLSHLLELDPGNILNHGGSPHGGPGAARSWAAGFFAPVNNERRFSTVGAIELVVVRKSADIKDYGTGIACHYSDLLLEYAPVNTLRIRDVTKYMTHLELSTRDLKLDPQRYRAHIASPVLSHVDGSSHIPRAYGRSVYAERAAA